MKVVTRKQFAFTIVELMVVAAILGVIFSMLIPAVARAKRKAELVNCFSNKRQVYKACLQYAGDYNDWFTPTSYGSEYNDISGFIDGRIDLLNRPDNTNYVTLLKGKNYPSAAHYYLGMKWQVFKCPSDRYVGPKGRNDGHEYRVRTIGQNALLGPIVGWGRGDSTIRDVGHIPSRKFNFQMTGGERDKFHEVSRPSKVIYWIDCHPSTVFESSFVPEWYIKYERGPVRIPTKLTQQMPSNLHSGGAGMIYVDGHAELKKWKGDYKTHKIWYSFDDRTDIRIQKGTDTYYDWKWLVRSLDETTPDSLP